MFFRIYRPKIESQKRLVVKRLSIYYSILSLPTLERLTVHTNNLNYQHMLLPLMHYYNLQNVNVKNSKHAIFFYVANKRDGSVLKKSLSIYSFSFLTTVFLNIHN